MTVAVVIEIGEMAEGGGGEQVFSPLGRALCPGQPRQAPRAVVCVLPADTRVSGTFLARTVGVAGKLALLLWPRGFSLW